MFTIYTEESKEKEKLEEEHSVLNDHFHVKISESSAIAPIIRSIAYETFGSQLTELTRKTVQMAIESLNLKFSLTLFRQILHTIKKYEQNLALYTKHFTFLSEYLQESSQNEEKYSFSQQQQETSQIVKLIKLQADKIQYDQLFITDFQGQMQRLITDKIFSLQKTLKTDLFDHTTQINHEQTHNQQNLQFLNNTLLSTYQQKEDQWKTQRMQRQNIISSSRDLSYFQKHGLDVMKLNRISQLIQEQARFDKCRQKQLSIKNRRSDETIVIKYNRKMKQKIMNIKLKKRRRI